MRIEQINVGSSYSVIELDKLVIGLSLVFDIYIKRDKNYVIIIPAGALLTQELFQKLQNQDKLYISKKDKDKDILSSKSLKFYIIHNKKDTSSVLKFLYEINSVMFQEYLDSADNLIDLKSVAAIVESIIYVLKENKKFLKQVLGHFKTEHELATHSLHVCIYSLNLGVALNLNQKELMQLGIASLLHDLGLKKIDQNIISKNSTLDVSELESIQKHTYESVQIVKKNNISDPHILEGIMNHHENCDGSGYPNKLKEKAIGEFASIIAIADVFDALTNNRPYREAFTSFNALKEMLHLDEGIKFNISYIKLLLKSLSD